MSIPKCGEDNLSTLDLEMFNYYQIGRGSVLAAFRELAAMKHESILIFIGTT
jgi:hypothetical protein